MATEEDQQEDQQQYTGTEIPSASSSDSETVPFESVPALAANEAFIEKAERLRELKIVNDRDFYKDKSGKGRDGVFEVLKRELAAMMLVNGVRSIAFHDLRISESSGGMIKGEVTGPELLAQLSAGDGPVDATTLIAIVKAAVKLDPQLLVAGGISPIAIARAKSPDKPKANSIKVDWIGKRARSGGGPVNQ